MSGEQAYTDEANGYAAHEDDADRYAMYEEIGRIKAGELAESLNRFSAVMTGMTKGFKAAHGNGPRPEDAGRLPFDVAWECAHVERIWRVYVWWLHDDTKEALRTACSEPAGSRCASHGGNDLLRERNDAIECADMLRKERDTAQAETASWRDSHNRVAGELVTVREHARGVERGLAQSRAARERDRENAAKILADRTNDLRNALGADDNLVWFPLVEEVAALRARADDARNPSVVEALERRVRVADRARDLATRERDDLGVRLARLQSLVWSMLRETESTTPEATLDTWRSVLLRSGEKWSGRTV